MFVSLSHAVSRRAQVRERGAERKRQINKTFVSVYRMNQTMKIILSKISTNKAVIRPIHASLRHREKAEVHSMFIVGAFALVATGSSMISELRGAIGSIAVEEAHFIFTEQHFMFSHHSSFRRGSLALLNYSHCVSIAERVNQQRLVTRVGCT